MTEHLAKHHAVATRECSREKILKDVLLHQKARHDEVQVSCQEIQLNEIFALLQDMSLKDLTSEEKINDKCPPDCYYAFSKLSDAVWGNGYSGLVDFHYLQNSVERIADLSACNSSQEVYVVLKAGFFAKNSNSCGKA